MNDNDEHMDECMNESELELVQIENSCPVRRIAKYNQFA
jgi:hypothetical protein